MAAAEQQVIDSDPATKALINAGASLAPSVFPTAQSNPTPTAQSTSALECISEDKADRPES